MTEASFSIDLVVSLVLNRRLKSGDRREKIDEAFFPKENHNQASLKIYFCNHPENVYIFASFAFKSCEKSHQIGISLKVY